MATIHHNDPDLIWIGDAPREYSPSRTTFDRLIGDGTLHKVTFVGDKRVFLRRSELNEVLGKPVSDVPGHDSQTAG